MKQEQAVKEVAAVAPKAAVKEVPLITVKAINQKILEQLYLTRGELSDEPYDDIDSNWVTVGGLATSDSILIRNMANNEIRLVWGLRWCRTKQNITDRAKFEEFRKTVRDSLPTIYVA